jgi:predicted RNA-binding Zn ribbon-like protein
VHTGQATGAGNEREPTREAERDIELVLSFLNTLDAEADTDRLTDTHHWRKWVAERRLGEPTELEVARRTRAVLRAAVGEPSPAIGGLPDAALSVRMDGGCPVLAADDAVSMVLTAAVRLAMIGLWERVKICPADDCRWAFYDRSRNRSRTWCSMQVCGNREKARIWREKHATA